MITFYSKILPKLAQVKKMSLMSPTKVNNLKKYMQNKKTKLTKIAKKVHKLSIMHKTHKQYNTC